MPVARRWLLPGQRSPAQGRDPCAGLPCRDPQIAAQALPGLQEGRGIGRTEASPNRRCLQRKRQRSRAERALAPPSLARALAAPVRREQSF